MELQITKTTLSPDEVKIVESLPKVYSDLVALRLEHPFSSYHPTKHKAICIQIITFCYSYSGQASNGSIPIQSEELLRLMPEFKDLTVSELKKAFTDGLDGIYGPYFGLCGKTYKFFLKSFKTQINRSKAWIEFQNRLDTPKSERVVYYKDDVLKPMILDSFKVYKDTGIMPYSATGCAFFYDKIKEYKGVKTLIVGDFNEIKQRAIKEYHALRKGREKEIEAVKQVFKGDIYECDTKKVALRMYWDSIETLTI